MTQEKINVAELLRNCPQGMELDCTMFDGKVVLESIKIEKSYPINIRLSNGNLQCLTTTGGFIHNDLAKCIIFPKGKTTWEGFVPSCQFKNGDVIAMENECGIHIFIYNHITDEYGGYGYYVILTSRGNFKINKFCSGSTYRFATEGEKEKLFQAIKDNGYKWNPDNKTLEELSKFKNGDVIVCKNHWGPFISIFKENVTERNGFIGHCVLGVDDNDFKVKDSASYFNEVRFATKREKERLFVAIERNGYRWNEETNTLERVLKFKVGDTIKNKTSMWSANRTIRSYDKNIGYFTTLNDWVRIEDQDNWELVVPDKFDINTLVPFESRVLVRDYDTQIWIPAFWGKHLKDDSNCSYLTTNGCYKYCIPYEGNQHLLGTTDDCEEYFKIWEH